MSLLTRRRALYGLGALVAGSALAGGAYSLYGGFRPLPPSPVFATDRVAIRGTDPVAYFEDARPVPGDRAHAFDWRGATWHFASAANRDAFAADPEAFAPRYGGFCAWAVAVRGELYTTQPENWSIVDGRLYLNFNDDIQARWEEDPHGFIAEADRRWPEIIARA